MKETSIEKKIREIWYEASDGTIFNNPEECKTYERTAYCVLASKLHNIAIEDITKVFTEYFEGSDENEYSLIIPHSTEDIDTINQVWLMFGGRNSKGERMFATITDIERPIIWGYRHCCGKIDWSWFYKLDDIVEELSCSKFTLESR